MKAPKKRSRKRMLMYFGLGTMGALLLAATALPFLLAGDVEARLQIRKTNRGGVLNENVPAKRVKLMTLNIAHGRNKSLNQVLLKRSTLENNLDAITAIIRREQPDVLALQEADGKSILSGRFDHVARLAQDGTMPFYIHGEHVKGLKMAYGTALITRRPMEDPLSIGFHPRIPTWPKGFVRSTIRWPGDAAFSFNVVSVHLDFLRASVRQKQIDVMTAHLEEQKLPLILMGDFNCDWTGKEDTLRTVANRLDLRLYKPELDNQEMVTFPGLNFRLDWVLISKHFRFTDYRVHKDDVSDHYGITAEIERVAGAGETNSD